MRHALRVLVCTAALVRSSVALAQDGAAGPYQRLEQMHHSSWTAIDGLTGMPTSLAQTTDGFLWIGTSDGVFRFDGVRVEPMRAAQGTTAGRAVSTLAAAPDGGLWVGYARGGVTHFARDGRAGSYSVADSLPVGRVRSIAVDHDGGVWVAAVGGLARLDGDRWRKIRMDWNYGYSSAWKLFVDSGGTLWVGAASPDRIAFLPRGAKRFIDVGVAESSLAFGEMDDSTLVYSHHQNTTLHVIRRGADTARVVQTIPDVPATGLAVDPAGSIWIGDVGVQRLRLTRPADAVPDDGFDVLAGDGFMQADGLSGAYVLNVLVDREGTIWATTENGLDRFRRRSLTWVRDSAGFTGASLVTDRDGEVWILTAGTPSLRRVRDLEPVPDAPDRLDNGYVDYAGTFWLSTRTELVRWNGDGFSAVAPPAEVTARDFPMAVQTLTGQRSGRLWASLGGSGVFHLDGDVWTFRSILPGRADLAPIAMDTDADDRVWLAYRDEVAVIDDASVRVFGLADGLDVGPLTMLSARHGTIWVGGEDGLALIRDDGAHIVRLEDGSDLSVVSIAPTDDGVWLGTAAGIVHIPGSEVERLASDPEHRVRHELFPVELELPEAIRFRITSNSHVWAAADAQGVLWFLTTFGIARLDPREIVRNTVEPPVAIRSVIADDSVYSPHGRVVLPPLTRTLRIEYTALSLAVPERVRFRHRLEGWETGWHDAGGRREVTYTDLRPGDYTLRVTASNNDGVWNETGTSLAFTIAPAWFQTLGFRVLVAAAILASLVAAYRYRIERISDALAARYDARLAERTRIARELHDTLLQTVHGSKIVADDALDRAGDVVYVQRAMEQVSQWLGRASEEGRAALNSLRGSDAGNDLAESLRSAADDPGAPHALAVSLEIRGTPRELHPIVRDEIYRIGYEAIRNACRHSGGTRLVIELEFGHDLTLRVADDGAGIDRAVIDDGKPGRFGLRGMRERAANIGAELVVEGAAPGTRITLVVPGRSVFRSTTLSRGRRRPTSHL